MNEELQSILEDFSDALHEWEEHNPDMDLPKWVDNFWQMITEKLQ